MSLNRRIILSASLVLFVFISLTAAALDQAFNRSTETALREQLTSQLYALMAATEVDSASVVLPSGELDALLGVPSSGKYARITGADNEDRWQSVSSLGVAPPPAISLPAGNKRFARINQDGMEFYRLAYGVSWSVQTPNGDRAVPLTFNLTTDMVAYNKQIASFRRTLWTWLLAMAVLLLLSQAWILRWGLSPLRQVGGELGRIEDGQQDRIEASYPQEIERLTDNINLLLQHEREQKQRYRDALGDLAHSLKTPLAVLQSGLEGGTADSMTAQQQITRMNAIVEYQLHRAATAGSSGVGVQVNLRALVERILESLQKVYRDRGIVVAVDIDSAITTRIDEGDLMEILGNLLDNAFKWTRHSIGLQATRQHDALQIRVCDDGPGMAPAMVERLLQRGQRADEDTPGHGIGLSIVSSIVGSYYGELSIEQVQPTGTCIHLNLPVKGDTPR